MPPFPTVEDFSDAGDNNDNSGPIPGSGELAIPTDETSTPNGEQGNGEKSGDGQGDDEPGDSNARDKEANASNGSYDELDIERARSLINRISADRLGGHLPKGIIDKFGSALMAALQRCWRSVVQKVKYMSSEFTRWRKENPKLFLAICILVILGVSTGGIVGIVSALGFTSGGVLAGSLAAIIHSHIGVVAAGSAFAFFQSVAATGAIWGIALGISVGGMGLWFAGERAIQGARDWWNGKRDVTKNGGDDGTEDGKVVVKD